MQLCLARTNKAEGIYIVAQLVEDQARKHQACHEHGWQKTQLSISEIEVRLQQACESEHSASQI